LLLLLVIFLQNSKQVLVTVEDKIAFGFVQFDTVAAKLRQEYAFTHFN